MVMEIRGMFYVYVDYREDDGKPFYVGKGTESRIKDLNRNQLHERIKNKHGIIRKIDSEHVDENEAFKREIELIQELETHVDFGKGGSNFTFGGEGCVGISEESKEKIRNSVKSRWEDEEYKRKTSESIKKSMQEIWNDSDSREKLGTKLSDLTKKAWENYEFREKQIEARKDEEYRKNISEKTKEIWEDPDHKSSRKASMKRAWEDPELRKKLSDSLKKTYEDPVLRREISERIKELWDDPEYKESTRESIKKAVNKPEFKKRSREITKKQWEDPNARDLKIRKMKEAHSKRTPEQKKEHLKKCWETRRLNKLKKEAEGKDSN